MTVSFVPVLPFAGEKLATDAFAAAPVAALCSVWLTNCGATMVKSPPFVPVTVRPRLLGAEPSAAVTVIGPVVAPCGSRSYTVESEPPGTTTPGRR